MRHITLIILFIGLHSLAHSQQEIEWTKELNLKGYFQNCFELPNNKKGILLNLTRQRGFHVDVLNEKQKIEKKIDFELRYKGAKLFIENYLYFKDEILVYTSAFDKETRDHVLLLYRLDKVTLKLSEPQEIIRIPTFEEWLGDHQYHIREWGSFTFRVSEDKSKIAVLIETAYNKSVKKKLILKVFDADLNALYHKESKLSYQGELFNLSDCIVDNNGQVSLLVKKYHFYQFKKKLPKVTRDNFDGLKIQLDEVHRGQRNYDYEIMHCSKEGDFETATIPLQNTYVVEMKIQRRSIDKLQIVGFTATKNTYVATGIQYLIFDLKSNQFEINKLHKLSSQFINEFIKNRDRVRGIKGVSGANGLELFKANSKLIVREDGRVFIIGQEHNAVLVTYINEEDNYTRYIQGNLFVISFSSIGDVQFAKFIDKGDYTGTIAYNSFTNGFFATFTDNKIHLFFNHFIKQKTSEFTQMTFNEKALIKERVLSIQKENNFRCPVNQFKKINKNQMMVYLINSTSKYKLAIIDLDK